MQIFYWELNSMRKLTSLLPLCGLGLVACTGTIVEDYDESEIDSTLKGEPPDVQTPFHSTPASAYQTREVRGWHLRFADDLEGTEAGRAGLVMLDKQLTAIEAKVPSRALEQLRTVTLWLSAADSPCPAACYHPNAQWLSAHGYDAEKAKGVEISSASRFVAWSATQPWMVLHELAHAYHDQVLGRDADIDATYEQVVKSGALRSVKYISGGRRSHYALTSSTEFFAEMSETFFGKNDFAPFTRRSLHTRLPEVETLIAVKWGAR